MRLNIRKQTLVEIYSGMVKLFSQCGPGVRIESGSGKIRATGTNYGETLVYEAESPENEQPGGTLILPTDRLKEIVCAYGGDTLVDFSEIEEGIVEAKWEAKGLASRHKFTAGREFPDIKIPDEVEFKPLDRERFRAGFLLCSECTTQERARFALHSIALDGTQNMMIATDGRQMYQGYGIAFPWEGRCLLPTGKGFPERLFFAGGRLEVAKTDKTLAFRNGAWVYSIHLPEDQFPPVEKLDVDIGDTELVLLVSEEDAERLIELLPHFPSRPRGGSVVEFHADREITLRSGSREGETESQGELSLTNSRWVGGPFEVCFSREYFIRAIRNGFRMFRFLPGNAPIVSETETGKYLFMPMTIHEQDVPQDTETKSEDQPPQESESAPKPTPSQIRKRRTEWLRREALWLASLHAIELGDMIPTPHSNRPWVLKTPLQNVIQQLAAGEENRKKKAILKLEDLLPPSQGMEWEELGRFERRDKTSVELVRSTDGFYSLRDEDGETDVTLEDMAGLFEPLLADQWKPFTLALFFNGQCWWTDAEFLIERTPKMAKRSLFLGISRPARKEHLKWEIHLHKRLLDEFHEALPEHVLSDLNSRVGQLERWLGAEDPKSLDLLPLCMTLAVSA